MSYLSEEYIQCEAIQKMLETEFSTCLTPQESMPFLEAVLSTQAASGIKASVSGDGKVKTVKVIYDQRLLESEATTGSGARTCTTNEETFNNYTSYTIDSTAWIKAEESFDTANLATVCTDDVQSMIAKKLQKIADVLERATATQVATQGVALYGEWGSMVTADNGSDELVVSTFIGSAANKVLDYTAMTEIDLALNQTGYCAPAIIVGGTTLYKYGQNIAAGCCSDTGVNILDKANQFGKAFMYDKRISAALASENKSLVFQAGSLALLTYNEQSQVPNLGANYAKFKIFSPRTGLPIDVIMSDDCGHISIIGYVCTKLVGLPTDRYKAGDEYEGVTLVNKILVTNS